MLLWLLLACSPEPAPAPAPAPAAEAPPPAEEPDEPAKVARLAVVKEVLSTDRYTFYRMDACGLEAWVAGPQVKGVAVDDVLAMPEGTTMTDFESVSLGRTFETILFVDWAAKSTEKPQCAPAVKAQEFQRVGRVLEAKEAGGYHYAKLDNCGEEFWIAGQGAPIQAGTTLLTERGSVMANFTSPTTGETYDEIVFVARYKVVPGLPHCE